VPQALAVLQFHRMAMAIRELQVEIHLLAIPRPLVAEVVLPANLAQRIQVGAEVVPFSALAAMVLEAVLAEQVL